MLYVQYQKAQKLQTLIDGLEPNLIVDLDAFRRNFFDIYTCGTTGLNNWGLLLNRSRTVIVPNYSGTFGFGDTLGLPPEPNYPRNYNHGNYYSGSTDLVTLPDNQYRTLLLFTYAYLTSNFSLMSVNKIMNVYCATFDPQITVQVTTSGVKQMNFAFSAPLQKWQYTIFNLQNVLPVPLGVSFTLS
jgi:hypothetical protein